ncbi:DMT family transporter [Vibrio sp. DW001]|uniref:DMT family transporter n=1 Tax=Vibrio sp. DW001 TaxID=2912315 RepID=UPI0023B02280|nr:DMT family transporter [Vibrio sp. DW001]WED27570.1 DMT family transporter [Vibrio sp. DW001]
MTSSINHAMNSKVWFMLLLLSILWGGSFFFVGIAMNERPPITIVTLRMGIAAATLWAIALMIGLRPPKSLKVWGAFLTMGLLNNVVPFVLIVWGQTQIASGLASGLNPVVTAAGQVTASTLILLPIALTVDGPIELLSTNTKTWAAITRLAVFSTAIAYVLYFKILELAGATNVLLVTLLVPVSAVLLDLLFLNESLALINFLGMLLIAFGLSFIDGRLWLCIRSAFA